MPSKPTPKLNFWQRYTIEWCVVVVLLAAFSYFISPSPHLRLANNFLYDRTVSMQLRAPNPEIVIVAVDDYSLEQIGRWPWRRTVHTELFNRLAQAQARAVFFDFLLTEPTEDDAKLGEAMGKTPHTVLPMLLANYGGAPPEAILPDAVLTSNVQMGHILVRPDEDGVLRQVDLSLDDATGRSWPLATRLLLDADTDVSLAAGTRVPFNIAKGAYQTVPYAGVVSGEVPLAFFKDKYVLVGATAVGLGDQYTTPVSGADGLVAGIEVHASILDSLLSGRQITVVDSTWLGLLNWALPLLMLMLAFFWTVERYHAALLALSVLVYGGLVFYLLLRWQLWLPPALTLLVLLLAYLLWSWRRVSVVLGYVTQRLYEQKSEFGVLPQLLQTRRQHWFVPHSIERGLVQTQRLQVFTQRSLDEMPTALILVGSGGGIILANQHARQLLGVREDTLAALISRIDGDWSMPTPHNTSWMDGLNNTELHGTEGEVYVLHVTAVAFDALGLAEGVAARDTDTVWLVHFLDLTTERLAQRQRSELMAFLSHDLRSPQVGILSLLELQKNHQTRLPEAELHAKIIDRVGHTLNWSRDLVRLTHARGGQYRLEEMSLGNLLDDVLEQLEPHAGAKQIKIDMPAAQIDTAADAWLLADGELLVRAMVNLVSNAIRYSPAGSAIEFKVNLDSGFVTCHIIDHGVGMDDAQIERLLASEDMPLNRVTENQPDAAQSMGVGFIMARTVIRRHGGTVALLSEVGLGTTVVVRLPVLA
ncbi:MAG: CHASE2 domain-containing protein [Formosimonas sp.]